MYPIITVVKFYDNPHKNSKNKIITRTLLKIGVVDTRWLTRNNNKKEFPKADEFWKVKIIKELEDGIAKGCFLLEPIEKIEEDDFTILLPGMYEEKIINNKLIIEPKTEKKINWVLPVSVKKTMKEKNIYATIIKH